MGTRGDGGVGRAVVEQTHSIKGRNVADEKQLRFTDTRLDEQQRGISVKSMPVSLVLESSSGKVSAALVFWDGRWN
jgi:translation elongation factor EF-G